MKNSSRQQISLAVFGLLSLLIIFNRFLLPRFDTRDISAIISWDVFGYYLYLPATLIHHDLGIRSFAWVQEILDTYHPTSGFYQAYLSPGGEYVMKYPMGLAIMYSPFYFSGQVLAHIFGYSPDGFTLPYQLSIATGGLIYTLLGIWFLRKILLHFFTDGVTGWTMLIIVAGTNYFQLTAFYGAMPHNYLFTLFALIVWFTIRWHETPLWKYAIPLGLLCGLATLIRPTAIIIVLVPLFWNIWGSTAFRDKILLVRSHLLQILVMAVAMLAVIGLQLIYWKLFSGSWLYYSYEKGEKLEWIAPYLMKVLFSYKKGWLLYTPLMALALLGFWPLVVKYRTIFLAVFVFFIVHLLIIASWPSWWYGGSFGQRAMMESYVLLAFPMGAIIQWIVTTKKFIRWPAILIIFLFIGLNLFQTWQYMNFILDPDRITKAYYWSVFGKTSLSYADQVYLEPTTDINEEEYLTEPRYFDMRVVASYDFEKPGQATPENLSRDTANSGIYSLKMSRNLEFSPGINLPYKELAKKDFAWIRASAWVYFTCKPEEAICGLVITCNQKGTAYKYRVLELEKQNLKPGMWNKVSMDYMTPYFEDKNSTIQVYFWYRGGEEVLIDDFQIALFDRKK